MRAVSLRALLAVMMIGACVAQAGTAGAGCGDVTDDEDVTASDALTVLRRAVGQSVELSCTYEDVMLDSTRPAGDEVGLISGYNPDPHLVGITSGGAVDVGYLGTPCWGFAASNPDYRVNFTASSSLMLLRFYWVALFGGDATMIVKAPDGSYSCDDDSWGTNNPTIDFVNPVSGIYDVWIGSFSEGESAPGTLAVTELSGNHP
jgi:hypothetical protein